MYQLLGRLLFLLASLLIFPVAHGTELTPFKAHYAAQFDAGVALKGKAVRTLSALDNNQWALSMNAKAFVANIKESSRFIDHADIIRPLEYRYKRRVFGKKNQDHVTFDWLNRTINDNSREQHWDMPATPSYDKVSYQLQLWRDVMAEKAEMTYQVADGNRLKTYRFRRIGEERVKTQNGDYDTILVARDRGDKNGRETLIWLAKDFAYVIVKLQQTEPNGKRYEILLDRLEYSH